METLHHALVYLHIFTGSLSLLLFWPPVVGRKGSQNHRKYGNWYVIAMTITSVCGVIGASMALYMPLTLFPEMAASAPSVEVFMRRINTQYGFLLMLSLLVWSNVRHAAAVLKHKQDPAQLRNLSYLWLPALLVIAALFILYTSLGNGHILSMIFAPIALFNGVSIWRYVLQHQHQANAWLRQHITHTIASGIGAYTAFFAFGGRTLFAGLGQYQLLSWILPSLIGVPFSLYMVRKYVRRPQAARSASKLQAS